MSTDKSLKHLKSKDNFLIVNVSNYFESTQVGTAHHIFNRLFRQLGSAEEPFAEYEKNYEKPVHFCRRNVQNGDNRGMSLMRLLSETMCRSFTPPTTFSFLPAINNLLSVLKTDIMPTIHQNQNKQETIS